MQQVTFGSKILKTDRPAFVMGIVNATPDSFFSGSRGGVERALKLIEEGADVLDIGGESTRPGYTPVSVEEEIARILEEFTKLFLREADAINSDMILVSNIDFVSAKAELAIQMDATKPALNDKGLIRLVKARHPLIDKNVVVPVDIELGKDYKSLIITGPNTGGKTVSLKTCGLLTLMAMAGLMIPCSTGSEISVFDRVHVRLAGRPDSRYWG